MTPASPWRPIESAPKDQKILVWARGYHWVAGWDDDRYAKKPRPFWDYSNLWGKTGCRETPPTHWMPLPDPPE